MTIKQLSIFVENRPGRLSAITRLLGNNDIDIRAMSIADTKDFGILRLIVNHPDKALKVLKENNFSVTITNVIAIGIEDAPGGLAGAMETLYENNVSVEYMYAFSEGAAANVIIRPDNIERCAEVLTENKLELIAASELYRL